MSNFQLQQGLASPAKCNGLPSASSDESVGQVIRLLRRINHATDLHSKHLIKATGLTTPQIIVLKTIHELGEVTAGTIAEQVSLSPGTVSMILDRLESHALIERYRSSRDRRVAHARLTQTGVAVLERSPPLMRDTFIARFAGLLQDEQARILSALVSVADMMDAVEGEENPI